MKRFERQWPKLTNPTIEGPEQPSVDPAAIDPDVLRDAVLEGFSALTEDESCSVRDTLLRGLSKAGLNVGANLLLIGHLAPVADELTPPDLAHLVRYVRINRPGALASIRAPLGELMMSARTRQKRSQQSRRAA